MQPTTISNLHAAQALCCTFSTIDVDIRHIFMKKRDYLVHISIVGMRCCLQGYLWHIYKSYTTLPPISNSYVSPEINTIDVVYKVIDDKVNPLTQK